LCPCFGTDRNLSPWNSHGEILNIICRFHENSKYNTLFADMLRTTEQEILLVAYEGYFALNYSYQILM
jgi:hypothetical protein